MGAFRTRASPLARRPLRRTFKGDSPQGVHQIISEAQAGRLGRVAASVYEVMGWGAETFLKDWDEVVRVQNQATLDGSPVAQTIIKFMEDRKSFEGSSTELHKKLESIAAQLGVDVDRDKAWPKSAPGCGGVSK